MKILTRQVLIQTPIEETLQTIHSCAYFYPKAKFAKNTFSIYCARRHNGGYLYLTNIRGNILESNDRTTINLEVHANLYFFIGCTFTFIGILCLFLHLISYIDRWIPFLGMILLGLLISGQALWTGFELLDLIEHKVTR